MGDNIGRESGRWFENVHHSQAKCLFLCFSENAVKLHWKNTKQKLLFRRSQMPIVSVSAKGRFPIQALQMSHLATHAFIIRLRLHL